jgi:hypothetical protein
MADYCTLPDAELLIKGIEIDESTTPSTADCGGLLSFVTADLNGLLDGYGYPLPVPATDTTLLGLLKVAASYGLALRIVKSKYPADSGAGADKGAAGEMQERYNESKDLLRKRAGALGSTTANHVGEGTTHDACGHLRCPLLTKEKRF